MPKILFVSHDGKEMLVDAEVGRSLMQAALDNLVPGIVGDCGGCCTCATCHGYVDGAWVERVGPKSDDEEMMLQGAIDIAENSRLTCQIKVTPEMDGLVVRLPASQF